MTQIDARGLSCPEPVVLTRNALKSKPEAITVLVDAAVARENVTRFATHAGYEVSVADKSNEWELTITRKQVR